MTVSALGRAMIATMVLATCGEAFSSEEPPREIPIKSSISALRNQRPEDFYAPGGLSSQESVRLARGAILADPGAGLALVKKEAEAILASSQEDYVFLQEAAGLAWAVGGKAEVDYILSLWRVIPPGQQDNGVYHILIQAAQTREPAVIPLLEHCLGNHEGTFHTPERGILIQWPTTVKMAWALYGPAGLPVLNAILGSAVDAPVRHSALLILAQAQYLPALPALRALAFDAPTSSIRQGAVAALGGFGHPDDYPLLTAGVESAEGEDLWARAFALFEYEDLRAAALLASRLNARDPAARTELLAALSHLPTPGSLRVLKSHCASLDGGEEKRLCGRIMASLSRELNMPFASFLDLPDEEQRARAGMLVDKMNARFRPTPGREGLDRAAWLSLLAGWQKGQPLLPDRAGLAFGDLLKASAPEDLSRIYEALAVAYSRLSETSWGEIHMLEDLLKRTGRKRYRTEVALTAEVAAP